MLSLAFIVLALWALVALGVVVLCVAARRIDGEIADEGSGAPRRASVPRRSFGRVVSP